MTLADLGEIIVTCILFLVACALALGSKIWDEGVLILGTILLTLYVLWRYGFLGSC